jgi:hypothetical protein
VRIRLVLLMSLLVAVPGSASTDPAADPALNVLGGTPRQIVAQTGQRTVQAGTARIAMELNRTGGQAPGTSNSTGVIDLREKVGEVKLSATGWMPFSTPGVRTTVISANGDAYVGLDDARRVPGMKPWIRMIGSGPFTFGSYIGLDFSQPHLGLEELRDAVSVIELGRDRLRGVTVRHFHAEISVERYVASLPPGSPAEDRKALVEAYHQAGTSSLPVDVWVDGQGRVRKLQSRFNWPAASTVSGPGQQVDSPGGVLAWTVEFYEFGVPVHVEIPPADQVTDF